MATPPPKLEELIDFPDHFTFRVVAAEAEGLADRSGRHVAAAIGRPVESVTEKPSSRGNWRSVRVVAIVHSAAEIRAAYAALQREPGVKMLL
jgi:hypothetical protein